MSLMELREAVMSDDELRGTNCPREGDSGMPAGYRNHGDDRGQTEGTRLKPCLVGEVRTQNGRSLSGLHQIQSLFDTTDITIGSNPHCFSALGQSFLPHSHSWESFYGNENVSLVARD